MAKTANGWEALPSDSTLLYRWTVPEAGRSVVLRYGSAGFLLAHFALWFHESVQPLNIAGQPWDEWGYAYREVSGSSDLSNHASGTAVDLNATLYPVGTLRMTTARKALIRARLAMYLGAIRWGGDYNGRVDEMHFEINRGLKHCERMARLLMRTTPRGRRILAANPGQREVILS